MSWLSGRITWEKYLEAVKASDRPMNSKRKDILVEIGNRYLQALLGAMNQSGYRLDPDMIANAIDEEVLQWPIGRLVLRRPSPEEKYVIVSEFTCDILFNESLLDRYLASFLSESVFENLKKQGE